MKKIKLISYLLLFCVISVLISNCKHDPNEIPTPKIDTTTTPTPTPTPTPNPKDSICFSNDILPIFASSCAQAGCHDDATHSDGVILISYQSTISTLSGKLLMQVIQDSGENGMPLAPTPKLNATQIATIQSWVNQGMKNGIDCSAACDTTNITYTLTIQPIMQNSCVGCHGTSGGIALDSYANVKKQVDNGRLNCTINWASGCSAMPKNTAKLSDCKLKQIKKWIDAGAPNN